MDGDVTLYMCDAFVVCGTVAVPGNVTLLAGCVLGNLVAGGSVLIIRFIVLNMHTGCLIGCFII